MHNPATPADPPKNPRPIARQDWILLPVFGLLTICIVLAATELVARSVFHESTTRAVDCMILTDSNTGVRAIPNSVCWEKLAEDSAPIEYRFNRCGHRDVEDCDDKLPGRYRIVMTGSSYALGLEVARENSFATLLPANLSRETGRGVDLYNEGMEGDFPHSVQLKLDDVIAAQPDLILWVLTPFDIKKVSYVLPDPPDGVPGNFLLRNWLRLKQALATEPVSEVARQTWQRFVVAFAETRTAFMLRHLLFQSQSQYVRSYLKGDDDETGFLKAQPSALWEQRLRQFDLYASDIARRAASAGVPLAVVYLPTRPQAAIISMGHWSTDIDPFRLSKALRTVIERNGGIYFDVSPQFRTVPNPERGYFPVDGHANSLGHFRFSVFMSRELMNGSIPALAAYVPHPNEVVK